MKNLSGFGTVGRMVASKNKDLRFESITRKLEDQIQQNYVTRHFEGLFTIWQHLKPTF